MLKEGKYIYIPILQTLQQIIKNESIRNEVVTHRVYMYNVCTTLFFLFQIMKFDTCTSCDRFQFISDGWQAKEHEVPRGMYDCNFKILAYFDEIEICNPLGANTKVHKLGTVIFALNITTTFFRLL